MIEDDDIISYYKPEITSIFVELMSFGRDVFKKMNEKRNESDGGSNDETESDEGLMRVMRKNSKGLLAHIY
ncbi:MAG: hypothetical protein ACRD8W_28775, partial [Nitrososphaeraceae archaeon]